MLPKGEDPTYKGSLNKLPGELQSRSFFTKHRLSVQIGGKRAKKKPCVQLAHISTELSILHATLAGWEALFPA